MQLYKLYLVFMLSFMGNSISGNMEKVLLKRYNNVVNRCFDAHKNAEPAYQCSGLVIRGIQNGKGGLKYAWCLKNSCKEIKSFSFAFLRRDQFFDRFPSDYEAGFILYPNFETPKNKFCQKVRCAFPLDGHTDGRADRGCGQHFEDETGLSKRCDELGVTTIEKWTKNYHSWTDHEDLNITQCAFDMTKGTAARNFEIVGQANKYIRANTKEHFLKNNELLMTAWNENQPDKIPIQAFFYITSSIGGYTAAKLYQNEYRNLTHENVPIVGISLPTTMEGNIMIINAGPCGMPIDNKKIVAHPMKNFAFYGSHHGVWRLRGGQHENECDAYQISGIVGHVTDGIVADKFVEQNYYIYLTKTIDTNHREYYAMKDVEYKARKINGLPEDALILAINNLGGVIYFGSSIGAFELVQGELNAYPVPDVSGSVHRIVLGASRNPKDAKFSPA